MNHLKTLSASAVIALALAVGGCASSDHPDGIPASATMASQGMGTVAFTAPSRGKAYVYDNADDRIVWSGDVHRGDMINVDTDDHRVMLNNQIAADKAVIGGHRHRIFFDSSDSARLASDRDRDARDRDVVVKDGDVTVKRDRDGHVIVDRDKPDVVIERDRGTRVVVPDSNDTTIRKETTVKQSDDGTTVTKERTIERNP